MVSIFQFSKKLSSRKHLRQRVIVYFFVFLIGGSALACGTRSRLDSIEALETMCKIRTAQLHLHSVEGHYGSFDQLISKGLIAAEIIEQPSYTYKLVSGSDTYSIEITSVDNSNLNLYMDQSGVIRASENSPATKNDEPIKMQ